MISEKKEEDQAANRASIVLQAGEQDENTEQERQPDTDESGDSVRETFKEALYQYMGTDPTMRSKITKMKTSRKLALTLY